MTNKNEHILVRIGKLRFEKPNENSVHFIDDTEGNLFLNDLKNHPHAFVLACLMDRQIKSEKAWVIPIKIKNILGTFNINDLYELSLDDYIQIFTEKNYHRFPVIMAKIFHSAVQKIVTEYKGNASNIWNNNPSSAAVIYRFLQFDGVGIKIATMAANILARQFKIPFSDYYSIDVSPDVHVCRVFKRVGLVSENADIDSLIYKARELYPKFPGIVDFTCWEIGRKYCSPVKPNCENCIINLECKKVNV